MKDFPEALTPKLHETISSMLTYYVDTFFERYTPDENDPILPENLYALEELKVPMNLDDDEAPFVVKILNNYCKTRNMQVTIPAVLAMIDLVGGNPGMIKMVAMLLRHTFPDNEDHPIITAADVLDTFSYRDAQDLRRQMVFIGGPEKEALGEKLYDLQGRNKFGIDWPDENELSEMPPEIREVLDQGELRWIDVCEYPKHFVVAA